MEFRKNHHIIEESMAVAAILKIHSLFTLRTWRTTYSENIRREQRKPHTTFPHSKPGDDMLKQRGDGEAQLPICKNFFAQLSLIANMVKTWMALKQRGGLGRGSLPICQHNHPHNIPFLQT